jgi:hypothetical protein
MTNTPEEFEDQKSERTQEESSEIDINRDSNWDINISLPSIKKLILIIIILVLLIILVAILRYPELITRLIQ